MQPSKMESRRRAVRSAPRSPLSSALSRGSLSPKRSAGGRALGTVGATAGAAADSDGKCEDGDSDGESEQQVFSSPLSCRKRQSASSFVFHAPSSPREDAASTQLFQTPTCRSRVSTPPHQLDLGAALPTSVKTPSKSQTKPAAQVSFVAPSSPRLTPLYGAAAQSPALGVGRPGAPGVLEETPVLRRERQLGIEQRTSSVSTFLAQVEDLLLRTAAPYSASPWWWQVDVAQMLSFFLSLSESGAIQLGDAGPRVHAKAAFSASPPASHEARSQLLGVRKEGWRDGGEHASLQGEDSQELLLADSRETGSSPSSPIVTPRRFVAAAVAAVDGVCPPTFSPLTHCPAERDEASGQGSETYRMEFSEAALLLERLAKVWGRKIEHLHALVLHMLQSMHAVGDGKARGAHKSGVSPPQNLRFARHSVLQEVVGSTSLFLPTFPRESEARDGEFEEVADSKRSRAPDLVRLPPVLRRKGSRLGEGPQRRLEEEADNRSDAGRDARGEDRERIAELEEETLTHKYRQFKHFRLTSFLLHEASGGLMVDTRDAPLYQSLLLRPEKKRKISLPSSVPSSSSASSSSSSFSSSFSSSSASSSASSSSSSSSSSSLSCVSKLHADGGRLPSEGLGEFLDFDDDGLCFDVFDDDPASSFVSAGVHTPEASSEAGAPGDFSRVTESGDFGAAFESSIFDDVLPGDFARSLFWEEDREKQRRRQERGVHLGVSALPETGLASRPPRENLSPVDRILRARRRQEEAGIGRAAALRRLLHATGPGDWSVCTAPRQAKRRRVAREELGDSRGGEAVHKEGEKREREGLSCGFCGEEAGEVETRRYPRSSREKRSRRQQLMSLREEADHTERRPVRFGSCVRLPPQFYFSLPSAALASASETATLAFHRLHTRQGMSSLLRGLWSAGELAAAEAVMAGEENARRSPAWRNSLGKTRYRKEHRLPFYPDLQLPCSPFAVRLSRHRIAGVSSLFELPVSAEKRKGRENGTLSERAEEGEAGTEEGKGDDEERRAKGERLRQHNLRKVSFESVSACSAIGGILETPRWKWMEDVVYARLRRRAILRRRLRHQHRNRALEEEKSRVSSTLSPTAEVDAEAGLAEAAEERLLQPLEPATWRELDEADVGDIFDDHADFVRKQRENWLTEMATEGQRGVSLLSAVEKEQLQQQLQAAVGLPLVPATEAAEDHVEGFSVEAVQMKRSDHELLQRVARWTVFLEGELRRSSSLPPFDICAYEEKLLQRVDGLARSAPALPALCGPEAACSQGEERPGASRSASPDGKENATTLCLLQGNEGSRTHASESPCPAFSDVARGREKYEVCRLFLVALMLTNKGKLDIRQAGVTNENADQVEEEESSWELFLQGKLGSNGHGSSSRTRDFSVTLLTNAKETW
ncbi:UNVERIFIED_CONTAM: hypothetical protein HHA_212940 [Hammondia hammondi]|eukprot:XP_008883976.1 hypothetical protein HHA_212940 [Hammondia hammondi]